MQEQSKQVIIAIFLGWLGGYRFYKKQYVLGIIYLFTCGLFGIGWIVDIIQSCRPIKNTDQQNSINSDNTSDDSNLIIVTEFHTKVVGVTYECETGPYSYRQRALEELSYRDTLILVPYLFDLKPAYRVVNKKNSADIGNLSAELAKEITEKYSDCNIEIVDFYVTGRDAKTLGCNLKIRITKPNPNDVTE